MTTKKDPIIFQIRESDIRQEIENCKCFYSKRQFENLNQETILSYAKGYIKHTLKFDLPKAIEQHIRFEIRPEV